MYCEPRAGNKERPLRVYRWRDFNYQARHGDEDLNYKSGESDILVYFLFFLLVDFFCSAELPT